MSAQVLRTYCLLPKPGKADSRSVVSPTGYVLTATAGNLYTPTAERPRCYRPVMSRGTTA